MIYDVGDDAVLTAEFRVDGALVNPSTVSVNLYPPGATVATTITTPTITNPSTGIFRLVVDCTTAGTWRGAWVSTGTGKAAESFSFVVRSAPPL